MPEIIWTAEMLALQTVLKDLAVGDFWRCNKKDALTSAQARVVADMMQWQLMGRGFSCMQDEGHHFVVIRTA